jgi:ribosomal protein S16
LNPKFRPESISLNIDRIREWVANGGVLSPAVRKLIKEKGYTL